MVFPKNESGVYDFAMVMINGLDQHAELFPSVTLALQTQLDQALSTFSQAITSQAEAKSAAKNATTAKADAQETLEEKLHSILYLAEHDCIANPGNLEYIGWSGRREPSPLARPEQPRNLEAIKEGPAILTLKWLRPVGGGVPSSYKIERSDQPVGGGIPGPWTLISTSFEIEITLRDQPRGIEMQYRVIATNPAGDSMASSIVTVVL